MVHCNNGKRIMSNPWLKKSPFMSMWLSAANSATGAARGRITAMAKRTAASGGALATSEWVKFWTTAPRAGRSKKRR
jgi:hypothetical protein